MVSGCENRMNVGTALKKKLKILGIETCEDLIFYFPRRFDDFSSVVAIADLRPDTIATVRGILELIGNRRSHKSRMMITEGLVSDESGSVRVVWFNQPFIAKNFHVGDRVSLSGKTNSHYYDLQLVSPAYERLTDGDTIHTGRLTPVYSLPPTITQKQFRSLMRSALDFCLDTIDEFLPAEMLRREHLPYVRDALLAIHFPEKKEDAFLARRRFALEELFLLQLYTLGLKHALGALSAYAIPLDAHITHEFVASLPYALTPEQKNSAREILRDMKNAAPMNRLLQGDVGAGKTVVACCAMLNVVRAGYQCALMAPTEVLAQQHVQTLNSLLGPFHVSIALLTSATPLQEKKRIQSALADGSLDIVIGTHALIQEKVRFKNLALAVIDEQHRFGVKQRKRLREQNSSGVMPHLLSMTATPIPRSLALTVYGDLDISSIRTLPKGRKKIITKIVPQAYRAWTYDFIAKQIAKGYQAYVLCAIINPSDTLGARSVTEEYTRLTSGPFAGLRGGMLHGKMKSDQKENVMAAFRDHSLDILVTTSVIEVGIDVPNATIMFIEGAERFGLAQLHQLRGRVGRAEHQSYCFLTPSDEEKEQIDRLKAVVASHDGFVLAEKDLQLRGEGDVSGLRQSGLPRLKIATFADTELIQKARMYANEYSDKLDRYPELKAQVNAFQHDVHLE